MKSCGNCVNYIKTYKHCNEHRISISSLANAQHCGKYIGKDSKKKAARRKRCNTCRHFLLDAALYKCNKTKRRNLPYTALMACGKFEKIE